MNVERSIHWLTRCQGKIAGSRAAVGWFALVLLLLLAGSVAPATAQTNDAVPVTTIKEDYPTHIRRLYIEARKRYLADATNTEALWHYARACFDLAVYAVDDAERAQIAQKGIDVSRQLIARRPDLAEAHYYLGMNIGELADTKRNLAALKMVKEMEREFDTARQQNEKLDYGGPDRNLGLLYWQAPSIVSIGSRTKARQHLQRAVELAPDYPENRLNLIEACTKWGDRADALRELRALEKLWTQDRQKWNAEAWIDWEKRLSAVRKKYPEAEVKAEQK